MMILLDALKLLLRNGCSDGEEIQAAKDTALGYFEDVHLKIILFLYGEKTSGQSAERYFEIRTQK